MRHTLPSTPAEVLQVSSLPLRVVISVVVKLAETLGFWRNPVRNSATATEEMTALDNLYWIYKSKNPITRYERKMHARNAPITDLNKIRLPEGMTVQNSLSLGAGGDLLRSAGIDNSKDILFEQVQDLLFDQDISFANFESPITTQLLVEEVIGDSGPPVECCSKRQFDVLKGHKGKTFDVLHTANNHMFDMGTEGVETTLRNLADEGILDVGTNRTPDQYGTARILVRNGIKVGFVSDCFGLNGRDLPETEHYRIHVSRLLSKKTPPDLGLLKKQIADCRDQNCDFIIASIHWGHEFEFFPRQIQVETARSIVEYGADSIISHHPHVIQPVELYQTQRDPNRLAVIAYSLGSLTWGFMAPHIVLSLILNLELTKGALGGKTVTYLSRARVTPVFRTYITEYGCGITRIEKLARHVPPQYSPYPAPYVQKIKDHADLVLGEGWLSVVEG